MANNASDVLATAAKEVGYSRWTDPEQGTKYGRWYATIGGSYYATNGVPYCAMFASWVFARAGAMCPGLPGAYCPTMLAQARKAGAALANKRDAKPGDVLYFDWDGDGVVDHVGIVAANNGSSVSTIEGNTSSGVSGSQSNGGLVARRTRSWGTIHSVVRPSYSDAATASAAVTAPAAGKLVVDGWIGANTVRQWQGQLGTEADGVVSGQDAACRKYLPALTAVQWGSGGSRLVMAVQRKVGADADGYLGVQTVMGIQRWLSRLGYELEVDGYLGALTARAVQETLNDGKWKA